MPSPVQVRRLTALGLPALLAVVALASWGRFDNGFVWDDHRHLNLVRDVLEHGRAGELWTHGTLSLVKVAADAQQGEGEADGGGVDLYRPLTLLSFVADAERGGGTPGAFHLTDLLLHLATVALLYLVVVQALEPRFAQARVLALVAAGVLGLNPNLAEAHVWISGRFDVLCALLAVLALGLAMRGATLALAPVALLALFAKESALLALPLLAFVPVTAASPVAPAPAPAHARARARTLAAVAAAIALYFALRQHAIGASGVGQSGAELWTAARRVPLLWLDGLRGLLVPHRVYLRSLSEDYAPLDPLGCALALLVCSALALWVFRHRRELPLLAWGLAWYALTLAPAALITTRDWPGFGRLLYVPALGLLLGLAELVGVRLARVAPRSPQHAALAAVAALALLGLQLHAHTADYRSDRTLFERTIELTPERAHGYAFLGAYHLGDGRPAEAAPLLERAHQLAPHSRRYLQWLVEALLFTGQRERALLVAERGIASLGHAPELRLAAAYALLDADPARACRYVLDCLLEAPQHTQCREALTFLRTAHPAAASMRAHFDRLLAQPRYRKLAPSARLPVP
jgi:tetratricopeptide (TPR) repeat protein